MIQRARLLFLVALGVSVVILVANFPVGALMNGRSTIRSDSAELASLQAENRFLGAQVKALHNPAVVGGIAHSEYGLTEPGERSVVVLPGAAGFASAGENPLVDNPVPSSDLLPSDAILNPAITVAPRPVHEPGFWHRVASGLEFWHSL